MENLGANMIKAVDVIMHMTVLILILIRTHVTGLVGTRPPHLIWRKCGVR